MDMQARFVGTQTASHELFTTKGEGDIADSLRQLAKEHPQVR